MRHGSGIFRELGCPQHGDIVDPTHGWRAHVSRELLITQHRESFFQAELEPVTAGNPVAGPVMEIFMANNTLDPLVGSIGGCIGSRQDTGGVEDIQTLVLHRPHVEAFHRHDHEDIQVVFAAVGCFIPLHRILQRRHGVVDLVDVVGLGEDLQFHPAPTYGDKLIFDVLQFPGNQRKQVGRLHKRILPGHPVPVAFPTALDIIAVGQQNGVFRSVGDYGGRVFRQNVRPVFIPGDIAESFSFALSAEHIAGFVEPLERGILLRLDLDDAGQFEGVRGIENCKRVFINLVLIGSKIPPVDSDTLRIEVLAAIQDQIASIFLCRIRVTSHLECARHRRYVLMDIDVQERLINQVWRHLVVFQMNCFGLAFFHSNGSHRSRRTRILPN